MGVTDHVCIVESGIRIQSETQKVQAETVHTLTALTVLKSSGLGFDALCLSATHYVGS